MAVPKQRTNSARTGRRRLNHGLKIKQVAKNADGTFSLPHQVDPTTGKYKGRDYSDVLSR